MPVERLFGSVDASLTTTDSVSPSDPSAVNVTRWLWLIWPVPIRVVPRSSTPLRPSAAPSQSGVSSSIVRISDGAPKVRTITRRFCFDGPMDLVEFGPLTEELRVELEGDEEDPWDAVRVPPLQWRAKEQHMALRDARGRHVAQAGLLVVEVEVGGGRCPVVGLGGRIVSAPYRGRG